MLDACPHHHEEAEALEALTPRQPSKSTGPAVAKKFWRSLDELAETPAFQQMMHREFPHAAGEWNDPSSRRSFLKLMGASLALGGLAAGCTLRKTSEKIVPYVDPPEEVIPGRPLFFASSMPWNGYAKGVVVESHEGRPTKIEGNPDHPASLGASDIWMQASVLDLYDPDRSTVVKHGNDVSTWGEFTVEVEPMLAYLRASGGAGLRILTGTVTSPTIARQINTLLKQMPRARWHQYEVHGRRNARAGAIAAFGQDAHSVYRFDKADVIVSLDCNFLTDDPGSLTYAHQFIDGRRLRKDQPAKMNRLYVVETDVTLTGANADHRLAVKRSDIAAVGRAIAAAVNGSPTKGTHERWVNAVARDLIAARGRSLIIAGEAQPPEVHALAHALNDALGNVGATVTYVDPLEALGPDGPHTLDELITDASRGDVEMLVILGGVNPVHTAPPSMGLWAGSFEETLKDRQDAFSQRNPLARIKTIVHHGMYFDETAFFNTWHIPASHYLEAWCDLRAYDGTVSIVQPLIYPLYSSKSELEILTFLVGTQPGNQAQLDRSGYEQVRDTWRTHLPAPFEANWQRALEKGLAPNSASSAKQVALRASLAAQLASAPTPVNPPSQFELCFRPDPNVWDGRQANNAWLQELPKPITLMTWDNVALMSLKTANDLGVTQKQTGRPTTCSLVELKFAGTVMKMPALIMPGHADESVTVYLGYGRGRSGRVGQGVGFDTNLLRPTTDTWFGGGLEINVTDDTYEVATTQLHHLMDTGDPKTSYDSLNLEGRNLVKTFNLYELAGNEKNLPPSTTRPARTISLPLADEKNLEESKGDQSEDLLPNWKYEYNKWGMVIDNNACIGCNACVVACQSENNIPVVGKDMVLMDREMHWLRIDTYFLGEPDGQPDTFFQPVPCMQCETAPCTLVCPVEATSISAEGINEQTYNRCVGTRYCSNNCPYKVRRFNFLYYNDYTTESTMLGKNPNVTVRSRGVMEKCNYCVQRVNNARIEAKKLDRPIAPGEVVTACAQACPTQAIIFGNLNDDRWEVTKLQDEPLRYSLLEELNTRPRTTYMARVRNLNPEIGA
jgi:MoCo/4Fe-4S cofactor protein with predicted Tat translocation signal